MERQAADDPDRRLRPPPRRQEAGPEAALGHDHPGADRPGKGVALLSLPRDLKVEIPGHGTDKINAAYALGGPKLTIKTVKQLTGLAINHYVDVSFRGFDEGVTRSAASTSTSTAATSTTTPASARPELRRDQRAARLPEDVRAARRSSTCATATPTTTSCAARASRTSCARCAPGDARKLLDNVDKMIDIFADNTRSDIHSTGALRRLLRLMLGVSDKPIKQVKFHGRLGESYCTAAPRRSRRRRASSLPATRQGPAQQAAQERSEDRAQEEPAAPT